MARILTAGNEFGHFWADGFQPYGSSYTLGRNTTASCESVNGNSGNYGFYFSTGTGLVYDFEPDHPAGISEWYFRMHIRHNTRADGTWEVARFTSPTDVPLAIVAISGGSQAPYDGGYCYVELKNGAGSNLVASGSSLFYQRINAWNLIECYVKLGPAGSGVVKLWSNEKFVGRWTGTLLGSGGEDVMHRVVIDYNLLAAGTAGSKYIDDVAINDTTGTVNNSRIGDGYILPFWPSGNGTTCQLVNTLNNSVDNFKFINSVAPAGDLGINFLSADTPNAKDTYALSNPPAEFNTVNSIKVAARCLRFGTAITKAKMILQPPAQSEVSGPVAGINLPHCGFDYIGYEFSTNPNNSNLRWTISELSGMEAGIQFIA